MTASLSCEDLRCQLWSPNPSMEGLGLHLAVRRSVTPKSTLDHRF